MARMTAMVGLVFLLVGTAWAQQAAPTSPTEPSGAAREHQVYRMRHLPVSDAAEALHRLFQSEGNEPTNPPATIVAEPVTNCLLLGGSSQQIQHVVKLLEQLDHAPASVVLPILMAEVTLPKTEKAATSSTAPSATKQLTLGEILHEQDAGAVPLESLEKLESALKQQSEAGHVHFLARPQLMTLDNQPATLQIGRPTLTCTASQGGMPPIPSMENVGLKLTLMPRVVPDGTIVLDLSLDETQSHPIADGLPVVETRSLHTVVAVREGQSALVADLVTDSGEERRELLVLVSPRKTKAP